MKNPEENNTLVDSISNALINFKDKAKNENENKIVNIAEKILSFNQLNQAGKGFKILRPNQMPSRLSIFLAQLKAGNNSEKLKNKIRQLLYSLYRSNKLTKQLYKS